MTDPKRPRHHLQAIQISGGGYAPGTDHQSTECIEACLACARACDAEAAAFVERGERGPVDALIACSATLQLVSDLIDEDADVDWRVLDLCIGACERCIDLGVGPVAEPCRRAARSLAHLFPLR